MIIFQLARSAGRFHLRQGEDGEQEKQTIDGKDQDITKTSTCGTCAVTKSAMGPPIYAPTAPAPAPARLEMPRYRPASSLGTKSVPRAQLAV